MPVPFMKPVTKLSYNELEKALNKTSLKLHPSQVHGLVCGYLCGNPKDTKAWEALVTGKEEPESTHIVLQSLYDLSAKQLREFLFEFQLMLPKDSKALPERAEALTLWCQGMLTGLKMADVPITERQQSELTEAINDLIEVAKMNYEDVVASEEDEVAYSDLVEYIRMVVTFIYQELHEQDAQRTSGKPASHLH